MATYTAGDIINSALRKLGVLAEGEVPSAAESADCLTTLDQMVESWNTERLSVYSTMDQVFTWPGSQRSRTLGPSGDFVGTRPIAMDEATYFKYAQISYNLKFINQEQYDSIPLKTSNSTIPQMLFVNTSYPDVELFLYPVPTGDLEFHFISVDPLTELAALTTVLAFPPGYSRAFVYNLALEIAPDFGANPSQDVRRIATVSKRNLKRINDPQDVMSFPNPILGAPRGYNIYTGGN